MERLFVSSRLVQIAQDNFFSGSGHAWKVAGFPFQGLPGKPGKRHGFHPFFRNAVRAGAFDGNIVHGLRDPGNHAGVIAASPAQQDARGAGCMSLYSPCDGLGREFDQCGLHVRFGHGLGIPFTHLPYPGEVETFRGPLIWGESL